MSQVRNSNYEMDAVLGGLQLIGLLNVDDYIESCRSTVTEDEWNQFQRQRKSTELQVIEDSEPDKTTYRNEFSAERGRKLNIKLGTPVQIEPSSATAVAAAPSRLTKKKLMKKAGFYAKFIEADDALSNCQLEVGSNISDSVFRMTKAEGFLGTYIWNYYEDVAVLYNEKMIQIDPNHAIGVRGEYAWWVRRHLIKGAISTNDPYSFERPETGVKGGAVPDIRCSHIPKARPAGEKKLLKSSGFNLLAQWMLGERCLENLIFTNEVFELRETLYKALDSIITSDSDVTDSNMTKKIRLANMEWMKYKATFRSIYRNFLCEATARVAVNLSGRTRTATKVLRQEFMPAFLAIPAATHPPTRQRGETVIVGGGGVVAACNVATKKKTQKTKKGSKKKVRPEN